MRNMRIINDHLLTSTEKTLIDEVLNFKFLSRSFFFDSLAGSLEIEIDPDQKIKDGAPIDRQVIEDALSQAEKELVEADKKFKEAFERFFGSKNPPRDLIQEKNDAENKLGKAQDKVRNLEGYLKNSDGKTIVPQRYLFGEFEVTPTPRVILYLGSFKYSFDRDRGLIAVLVHELFHAFDFFEGDGPRSVREVDEPMVEFAAGVFLKAMSQTNSSFGVIYTWHKNEVFSKTTGVGEIACYGYGRYLMDNVATKSKFSEDQWIESYAKISASIDPTLSDVRVIQKELYPFYPTQSESILFNLFEVLLFPTSAKKKGVTAGAGLSSSRVTVHVGKEKKIYVIIEKSTSRVLGSETIMRRVPLFIFRDYCSKNPGLTLAGLQSLFNHIYPYYISRNRCMSIIEDERKVSAYYASTKDSSRYFDHDPITLPVSGEVILVTSQWVSNNFKDFISVANELGYIVIEILFV